MRRTDREVTDPQEIEEIMRKADSCRLAFADNNIPYIVALNFGFVKHPGNGGMTLYFHSANAGRKLEVMARNNLVCFQIDVDHVLTIGDSPCSCGMNYRSITGMGKIRVVDDPSEKRVGLTALMHHYGAGGSLDYDEGTFARTVVLRLDVVELSAKKRSVVTRPV